MSFSPTEKDYGALNYVKERMPRMGFGTYLITDRDTLITSVKNAVKIGYRLVDTAQVYRNERFVGEAVRECEREFGVKRKELFITSKLHPRNMGSSAFDGIQKSMEALQMNYVDLYLLHWPGKTRLKASDERNKQARREAWLCLEKAYKQGMVKSIGVSNFEEHHLTELMSYCTVVPALNQCEFHPSFCPHGLLDVCASYGLQFQAYASLGTSDEPTKLLQNPRFWRFADKYKCSMAQLLLAWALSQGCNVIPKSTNPTHILENLKALDIVISAEDIEAIKTEEQKKLCWDPRLVS